MAQRLNIDIVARDKSKQALTGLKKISKDQSKFKKGKN